MLSHVCLRARNVNLIAITLFAIGSMASAHEPQAAFVLKGNWVECLVEQDGRPAANAALVILDAQGNKFADGETDDTGLAQFPAPAGSSFTVEIKTAGAKTADPIRIMRAGSRIEPARVLLSYGLRPCCRGLVNRDNSWKSAGPAISPSDRLLFWFAGAAMVCAVLGVIVFVRMPKRGCADGST
jgi:hypothetical protein